MGTGIDTVVLAGDGGFDENISKALLPIGRRVMVDYVIEALRNCRDIARIVLVGPVDALAEIYGGSELLVVPPETSPLGSFAAGVAVLDEAEGPGRDLNNTFWVLACTGDIPFLTSAAVEDFLDKCRARKAHFYYPIIPRDVVEARFPGVRRTYARLQEGTFTGGNLFLLDRRILPAVLPRAEEFIRLRKKPAALARLVGFGILWKYLLGRLSVKEAEVRVSELFGVQGAAVASFYPEIGVDVDKPADLVLARRLLIPSNV